MYIIKNAWINVRRAKGRNILIGIIITIVMCIACIALGIYKSGTSLINYYKDTNSLQVSFQIDRTNFRKQQNNDSSITIDPLTEELVNKIGTSTDIKSYYYTLEIGASSNQITAVEDNFYTKENDSNSNRPPRDDINMTSIGSYRLTAYSDVSYIDNFISGVSKITSGNFFDNDSTEPVIVINEELANNNNLLVGDTIQFYQTDSEKLITLTIVGIYTTTEDNSSDNFMNMSAMNKGNQIYTNLETIKTYFSNEEGQNNVNAYFYLDSSDSLDNFKEFAKEQGLSEYYSVNTNEDELLRSLEPIQNLNKFSMIFLILILMVGGIVISIINMIHIRERKYEVGVLRAIGMSKGKVIIQFLSEIFIVAIISLVIGTTVGTLLSQPVADQLLKTEISKQETNINEANNNFGAPMKNIPIGNNEKVQYIDALDISISPSTIGILFVINLGLILVGGMVYALFINKYEPNKILQNRT